MAASSPLLPILGVVKPPQDDPAWQPPSDPSRSAGAVKRAASIINREIPNPVVEIDWQWAQIREAQNLLVLGLFDRPSQLCEAILGDPYVQATIGARCSGLLGRPIAHKASSIKRVAGSAAAQECFDAWTEAWPTVANEAALGELLRWGIMLGIAPAQVLWDTGGEYAIPTIVPWHPRFTYYQYVWRALLAITLDGLVHVTPGDGHWLCHAPNGMHRGWMMGAMRSLASPWIQRTQAKRDLARLCERNGFPIAKILTPAAADPNQINALRQQFAGLGQESVVELPQGVDAANSYNMEWAEVAAGTGEIFDRAIKLCNMEIVLAILHENLTTEVSQGSFAAASVHGNVLQSLFEFDARGLERTIYQQLARPFAAINFGDADLAPVTKYEITPYADNATAAGTFLKVMQGLQYARQGGHAIDDPKKILRTFDIHDGGAQFAPVQPTQVNAAQVKADAQVDTAETAADTAIETAKKTSAPARKGSEDADDE